MLLCYVTWKTGIRVQTELMLTLKQDYPGVPGWAQCNGKDPLNRERGRSKGQNQKWHHAKNSTMAPTKTK
jgi:hypothetical protein